MSTYNDAKARCHVRSAIYRTSAPEFMFWKNHPVELDERVPECDKTATDWRVYDPKEGDAI